MSLVLEGPVKLGVGIDESTALVVLPGGRWDVVGESQAVVYDGRSATALGDQKVPGATGLRVHVLPPGTRWDPTTGAVSRP
jgi:cyanophycinase